jgi:DnaJ-class molecular chaperone
MTRTEARKILGVKDSDTGFQIRKAYLEKSRMTHPDVCNAPHATEQMVRINLAYGTLTEQATVVERSLAEDFGHLFGESLNELKI